MDLGAILNETMGDEIAEDLVPMLMIGETKRGEGEVLDSVFHEAENCILSLRSMAIQNRIQEVSQELLAAEQIGDIDLVNSLVAEQLDLSKMKHLLLTKLKES